MRAEVIVMRFVARVLRAFWREIGDAVEYSSNGDRRRPRFSEDSDIYDPAAGSGARSRSADVRAAERGERRD